MYLLPRSVCDKAQSTALSADSTSVIYFSKLLSALSLMALHLALSDSSQRFYEVKPGGVQQTGSLHKEFMRQFVNDVNVLCWCLSSGGI